MKWDEGVCHGHLEAADPVGCMPRAGFPRVGIGATPEKIGDSLTARHRLPAGGRHFALSPGPARCITPFYTDRANKEASHNQAGRNRAYRRGETLQGARLQGPGGDSGT